LLNQEQLTGRDESHLQWQDGIGLHPDCWAAFDRLREQAAEVGIDLCIASGFRSFERQLAIWNAKARGERGVHDDLGEPVDMAALDDERRMHAIMRYSALPGGSRHHWGTDLDIYDAAAMPADYQLQLTPQEYAADGIFGALAAWLDGQLAESAEFYRPYATDRGGVAPEPWHLSYRPLAQDCAGCFTVEMLRDALQSSPLELSSTVFHNLPGIFERYIAVPAL